VHEVAVIDNGLPDNRDNRQSRERAASPNPFDTASGNDSTTNFGETSPFLENNEENQNVWRNGWS
jgi:hypothetical protein